MAAPPGYHGWGPPPPHLAPAPYPTRPPYRPPPYAPPPGYAYPTGPPGPPGPGYRYAPPPEAPYREPPPRAAPPGGSYAEEKPAAYQAFKQQAVRLSSAGAEVGLSNGMCQDRHVKDFLLCFQCWLWRTYGDPERHGSWRLQRLDLSRNTLSDESLCSVLETLKALDLRVGRLLLSGNRLRGTGLAKVTDYIWNCRDPLVELDLSDNEIHGEVGESDGISGLLRCLYNHPSYPMMQEHQKAVPLQLGLGGNYIKDAQGLMNDILAKGSKDGKAPKIRICSSPESYLKTMRSSFPSSWLATSCSNVVGRLGIMPRMPRPSPSAAAPAGGRSARRSRRSRRSRWPRRSHSPPRWRCRRRRLQQLRLRSMGTGDEGRRRQRPRRHHRHHRHQHRFPCCQRRITRSSKLRWARNFRNWKVCQVTSPPATCSRSSRCACSWRGRHRRRWRQNWRLSSDRITPRNWQPGSWSMSDITISLRLSLQAGSELSEAAEAWIHRLGMTWLRWSG